MVASNELIYSMTRNGNCFLRKNLNKTFTADPFNASIVPAAGSCGFYSKSATSIAFSQDKKTVEITKLRKVACPLKKGKKHLKKMISYKISKKEVKPSKAAFNGCKVVIVKGAKIASSVKRAEKLLA